MDRKYFESLRKSLEKQYDELCPKCGGTGWVFDVNGNAHRCQCLRTKFYQYRMKFAQIPQSYNHCALDNYKPSNESQMKALKLSKRFVNNFENPSVLGTGILFRGPVGVGKTHLAVSILKELIQKGYKGLFLNFVHIIEQIKQSYDPQRDISQPEIFSKLKTCHILVLDELGVTKPTEFVFNKLYDIINFCFDRKISVIFTTNYLDSYTEDKKDTIHIEDFNKASEVIRPILSKGSQHFMYTLSERITKRLTSRILAKCYDLIIKGEDYRLVTERKKLPPLLNKKLSKRKI